MANDTDDLVRERVQSPFKWGWVVAAVVLILVLAAGYILVTGLQESSKIVQTLGGHLGPVTGVAFSSDGKHVASSSLDSTAIIWDLATGKPAFTLKHSGAVNSVAFSPDGARLATGARDPEIWSSTTGQSLSTLTGNLDPVNAMAWSPDGARLVAAAGNIDWVWDVATNKILMSYTRHSKAVSAVAWSSDGARVVDGSDDNSIHSWSSTSGGDQAIIPLPDDSGGVSSLALSPAGLAVGCNNGTILEGTPAGKFSHTLSAHSGPVTGLAFSPDGKYLASGSTDNKLKIWDTSGWQNTATFSGPAWAGRPVSGLAWSPDGATIAVGSGSEVRIWKVR